MSVVDRPLPPASLLRPSTHERTILRAIDQGVTFEDLLRCPKWTVDDVNLTIRRHHLAVTENGRIVPRTNDVRPCGGPRVVEVTAQLKELRAGLQRELGQRALETWIQLLSQALDDARRELRRLRARTHSDDTTDSHITTPKETVDA